MTEPTPQKRERWQTRTGFILAAAGSAVGLGNIWRFPYLAGENGGGAFLILYLLITFTIGISVLFAELVIGKVGDRNPIGAFRALGGGPWTIAAYFGACAAFLVLSFYSVVGGWTLAYIGKALTGTLGGANAETARRTFGSFVADPLQPVLFHGLFMVLVVAIVGRGVQRGIESAGRKLMPALFLLLLVLVLRAVTLPGALDGIAFYLMPDFSKVTGLTVIAALSQAFFSLSVGLGAMITYGSYLHERSWNLPHETLWVTAIDSGVAITAGLLIFSAVFAFGHDPASGPGLSFVTLPTIFEEMPGGAFFAVAFFVLLAVAALTSAVSLLEVPVAYFVDERGYDRRRTASLLGVAIFIVGIPSSLSQGVWADLTVFGLGAMELADFLTVKLAMPLGSFLLCLFAGWIAEPKLAAALLSEEGKLGAVFGIWKFVCRFVAPLAIVWILVAGLLD